MLTKRFLKAILAYALAVLAIAGGVLVARDPEAILGRQEVVVVAPATLRAGVEETVVVRVLRQRSGAPIAGRSVEITLRATERAPALTWHLGRAETGADGTATLRFRLPADAPAGRAALVIVAASWEGTERISLEPTLAAGGPGAARVLLTPVKTLWKPGETIQARALVLGPDGAPLAGEAVAFDLLSPGGTRIHRERARTSAFGIAALSFALDAEAEEGAWKMRLVRLGAAIGSAAPASSDGTGALSGAGGAADEVGPPIAERTLTVKRYRLPAFRAAVEPARRAVRPGEVVQATLAATTFEGKPVAGARFDAVLRGDGGETLARTPAVADADGRAEVRLAVPESFEVGPLGERRLFVEVEALDAADRVAKAAAVLFLSEVPLRVSALPEGGALVPGVDNRVYLVLEGPGGVPEGGEIEVTLPGAPPLLLRTGEEGVARLDAVRPTPRDAQAREVRIDVVARAGKGTAAVRQTLTMRVDPAAAGVLRCERAVYGEGDTVEATLLLGVDRRLRADAPVIALLERDGRTVATTSLTPLADGSGARGSIALPPAGTGIYRLAALLPEGDDLREVARRVLVRSDVEVTLTPDRAEYAPGEEVKLRARAWRTGGGPLGPCALGLQAVDRAVAELGHAVDLRTEVLTVALGADPGAGRLGRGFAARLFEMGGAAASTGTGGSSDVAPAALGGGSGADRAERLEATSAPGCRARDRAFREDAVRHGWAALLALLPAAFVGVFALFPGVLRTLLMLIGALVVVAVMIPNLIEARKGSNEAAAIGSLRTLTTAGALSRARADAKAPPETRKRDRTSAPASRAATLASPAPEPRSYFPEALLFVPEVVLDERGEAEVVFPMADALTEWRIDAVASTRGGSLAHVQARIVSRQVFHVDLSAPPFVREGDEVELIAVARNDGDRPLTVTLSLEQEPSAGGDGGGVSPPLQEPRFHALSPLEVGSLPLAAGDLAAARFRVRALRPGEGTVTVRARSSGGGTDGEGPGDAARRPISVRPSTRLLSAVWNGGLASRGATARVSVEVPGGAAATDRALDLRITASPLVEAIEGIESMLREPTGCFEQTSSSTWPNTLVLRYLRSQRDASPAVVERAQRLVRAGAQRLAGFEVAGGGFSLYGRAPASPWLSAYGLREFTDIAREVPVDPELLARTRRFLLAAQAADGSFDAVRGGETPPRTPPAAGAGRGMAHREMDPSDGTRLATTAYVLAALAGAGESGAAIDRAGELVAREAANPGVPPYALALAGEALAAWGKRPDALARAAADLAARGQRVEHAGGLPGLRFDARGSTLAGSYGGRAELETAAVAARVLARVPERRDAAAAAVRTVMQARAPGGGWGTTQGTVQALTTLLREADAASGPARGSIEVLVDGAPVRTVALGSEDAARSVAVRLGEEPSAGRVGRGIPPPGPGLPAGGPITVELRSSAAGEVSFQLVASARVPWDAAPGASQAPGTSPAPSAGIPPSTPAERGRPRLRLTARYGAAEVATGEPLSLHVELVNEGDAPAAAPMLDLPFPAGFEVASDAPLTQAAAHGWLARHDEVGSGLVLYLTDLGPGERRVLDLRLVARHAGVLSSGPARAYPYYNPEDAAFVAPAVIRVRP